GLLEPVNDRDVGMIERRDDLRLAFEPCHAIRIADEDVGQDFECNVAPQLEVARPIDFAHAACADRFDDLVDAETRAWIQWHRVAGLYVVSGGGFYPPGTGREYIFEEGGH